MANQTQGRGDGNWGKNDLNDLIFCVTISLLFFTKLLQYIEICVNAQLSGGLQHLDYFPLWSFCSRFVAVLGIMLRDIISAKP